MEPAKGEEELPVITTCSGVIFEEKQFPKRVRLVHNNADPHSEDDTKHEYKPAGYSPPGGSGEEGETPLETVKREVKSEAGIKVEIATYRKDSKGGAGEILFESKPVIDIKTGKPAINKIYIFHLKRIGDSSERIEEIDETEADTKATFGRILMMPLARKKIINPDESVTVVENPEGIYFSARERIFGVAEYLGLDFYELIPNLEELFLKLKKEEVGWYIHGLLSQAIEKKREKRIIEAQLAEEARLRHTKICGSPDDKDLEELYAPWEKGTPNDLAAQR